jgi:hypothetical protein
LAQLTDEAVLGLTQRVSHGRQRVTSARSWAFATAGLAAGFSGLAVIATILTGAPLVVFEVGLAIVPLVAAAVIVRRAPRAVVIEVWGVVRIGLIVGALATLCYDVTRTALSYLDPSPYNPFEAVRHFGLGVTPIGAPAPVVMAAGFVVHFVNGSAFGVIYASAAGRNARTLRSAVIGGVAWGLTLEFIQSILYPGWLHITTVLGEFLLISGLGHLCYGACLGMGVRSLMRRDRSRLGLEA